MTARLVLAYSAAAFCVLLIVTTSLFWVLRSSIWRDDADALEREIIELTDLLRDPTGNAAMLALEVNPHRGNSSVPARTYLRVAGSDHQTRVETQGMGELLPEALLGTATANGTTRVRASDGRPFLVTAASDIGAQHWRIDAAMDLWADEQLIARYRGTMVLVLVVALIASVAGGVWLTRRGLRPLYGIADVIHRIGLDRLDERVDATRWPLELEQLAQAFDQMLDRLEAPVTRLQQLAADLAHELRTPINALIGETEVALAKPRDAAQYRAVLESNLEEHHRLARLVDNLLFLARSAHPGTHLSRTNIDVRDEVGAVVAFYDAVAQENGVAVVCDGSACAWVDAVLLRRTVSNLLANALHHTHPGGTIRIMCSDDATGATVAVSDDGTGIATADLPHVFERFYRSDTARQRHDGGAGLGLSIVASILALHGGRVSITSTPAAGTCVTMWFPAAAT
jgi:two-component system, OmpR family, heavy metal sensor histidine kinase CusS